MASLAEQRHASIVRIFPPGAALRPGDTLDRTAITRRMWTTPRSTAGRLDHGSAAGRDGAAPSRTNRIRARSRKWPPADASRRRTAPTEAMSARQSRAAVSQTVSSTGCRSKVERLMTLSTSLVAVWYSNDSWRSPVRSVSSLNSRTFSIAITAWAAKVFNRSICLSLNSSTWRR